MSIISIARKCRCKYNNWWHTIKNFARCRQKVKGYQLIALLFLLIVLMLTLHVYLIHRSVYMEKARKVLADEEILDILKTTPYLFRKSNFEEDESVGSRIDDQTKWITRISKTKFIKNAQVKEILVDSGMSGYYGTEGRLRCEYAPEFESKCTLIDIEVTKDSWWWWRTSLIFAPWKYDRIDGFVGVRNWGYKRYVGEATLPRHILQIFYILETPNSARYVPLGVNNALYASYKRGSDIPVPYRRWIPSSSVGVLDLDNNALDDLITGKKKIAVAIISNCNQVYNNRMGYIKELQKYIDVDVYGKCGTLKCPRDNHENCMKMVERDYKFYLAFENNNCVDYITEKFLDNGLNYNIVPIVMGAHPSNYKTEGPPNSYLHVNDFESPKELAQYLQVLDRNDSLYKKYLRYKGTGYVTSQPLSDFFCRVCGMLYYADFVPPPVWNSTTTIYEDVSKCLPTGQWFWP